MIPAFSGRDFCRNSAFWRILLNTPEGVFLHYGPSSGNAIGLRWRRTLLLNIFIELLSRRSLYIKNMALQKLK